MSTNRRKPSEINAGSMADIAFLLLIFFLVTTTMDRDTGIMAVLPPKMNEDDPPAEFLKRDVLEVSLNFKGDLLVEEQSMEISELKDITKEFMTNPTNSEAFPELTEVTTAKCNENIAALQQKLREKPDDLKIKRELEKWKNRKTTVEQLGAFKMINPQAVISLQNQRATKFETFITVRDQLHAAINELRDELCQTNFGVKFKDLEENNPNHRDMIVAARTVYPYRISEAEPVQTVNVVAAE